MLPVIHKRSRPRSGRRCTRHCERARHDPYPAFTAFPSVLRPPAVPQAFFGQPFDHTLIARSIPDQWLLAAGSPLTVEAQHWSSTGLPCHITAGPYHRPICHAILLRNLLYCHRSRSRRGKMKIEGGCLCGKVRYSADVEPTFVGVCH